jgi:hypothetical protein
MENLFEDAFDPNNKTHARWLKNLVNCNNMEETFTHNPLGIIVNDCSCYMDVVHKLSKKFINSSVYYKFGEVFSYEYAYHMDGEYQNCHLLKDFNGFEKGTHFEYALVYPTSIDFYKTDEDFEPTLVIERW